MVKPGRNCGPLQFLDEALQLKKAGADAMVAQGNDTAALLVVILAAVWSAQLRWSRKLWMRYARR